MKNGLVSALVGVGVICGGCAWVKVEPGAAERVRVATAEEVADCKRVGQTVTQTRWKVGPFGRSEARMDRELETLARNTAPGLGADTIVAEAPVERRGVDAIGRFGLFDCSRPADWPEAGD